VELDPGDLDPGLLAPAVNAARIALRRMDDEHVPAGLRAVAVRSGRLPPPLMRSLLTALDGSEWLRDEAMAAWSEMPESGRDRREQASILFLRRPPGWEEKLAGLQSDKEGEGAARASVRLASDLGKARTRIAQLEEQLGKAEERAREAGASVEARLAEQAEKLGQRQSRSRREIGRLQRLVADLQQLLETAERGRAEAEAGLEQARKRRARSPSPPPGRGPRVWPGGDPLDLARHLDDLNAAGQAPSGPPSTPRPAAVPVLQLPGQLRPDRSEALVWLTGLAEAVTLAIDGWNAAHLLASPPTRTAWERIVEAGRRISVGSRGRRRVMVVFDSRAGNELVSYPEVEVRFVASADEEIISLAVPGLVVISSDRRVREEAEARGAIGLWSEALVDWLQTEGRRTFGG
jgi:hypothetical protein